MKIPYYQVDAFVTEKPFSGNPAGVCMLDEWLPDDILQSIAFENNLSETAFIIENPDHFKLRWFTPILEMDLCGHATLAPAFLIMNVLGSVCLNGYSDTTYNISRTFLLNSQIVEYLLLSLLLL